MAREMAVHGTHEWVLGALAREFDLGRPMRVLDVGAGQGALSARLKAAGMAVSACDPESDRFCVPGVECKRCDDSGLLPFAGESFDLAIAVEVLEHMEGHDRFFAEAARVLKPEGALVFTTPNILSLKSRVRFLLTGFFYSFGPLTPFDRDPVNQHISPLTLNRYVWSLSRHGFRVCRMATDRIQRASLLLSFLVPLVRLSTRIEFGASRLAREQNSWTTLLGRKLLIVARKAP